VSELMRERERARVRIRGVVFGHDKIREEI
jgi:hypothetical protein